MFKNTKAGEAEAGKGELKDKEDEVGLLGFKILSSKQWETTEF